MYSKEDLIYKALQVDVEREHRYCQKVEEDFLQELNRKKPKSLEEVSRIWYKGVMEGTGITMKAVTTV